MTDATPKDFFISYTTADEPWAEWIAWQLEAAGYTTHLQAWDFVAGANWALEMERGTQAERTIVVLSPRFLEGTYTQPEWATAFRKDATGAKRKLVPVRIEACEPTGLLGQIVHVDLVGKPEAEARTELLEKLKDRLKPSKEPAYPGTASSPHFPAEGPAEPEASEPITRWALVAGARPDDGAVAWTTLQNLAPAYKVQDGVLLEGDVANGAQRVLEALDARKNETSAQHVWVYLSGRLDEQWGQPILRLGQRDSNIVHLVQLAHVLKNIATDRLIVLLDVDAEPPNLEAARALPWPETTVFGLGANLATRLAEVLQQGDAGLRTAQGLADAFDKGRTTQPELVLNEVLDDADERTPTDPERARREQAYFRYLEGVVGHVTDMDLKDGDVDPTLDAVYVEPTTPWYREDASKEQDDDDLEIAALLGQEERQHHIPLHQAMAESRCLFLKGAPGSGKTTFLHRLAWELCSHVRRNTSKPEGFPKRPFPVRVVLRDFAAKLTDDHVTGKDLLDSAFENLPLSDLPGDLEPQAACEAQEDGRLVLLLDGLDEVPGRRLRRRVSEAITELARGCPKLKILLTCRPAAARDGAQPGNPFESAVIDPFNDDQQHECVRKWMAQRIPDPDQAQTTAGRLMRDLHRHPKVKQQATNPLVLTMVCVLFRREKQLPQDRADLYSKLIGLLLRDRDRKWPGPTDDLSAAQRWTALRAIAWAWRHDPVKGDRDSALLLQSACEAAVRQAIRIDEKTADDFINFLEQRTALLDWHAGDGDERQLKFAHRTLAEYLVARQLAAQESDALPTLIDRAQDGDWREILLLFVNILARDDSRSQQPAYALIQRLVEKATHSTNAVAQATLGRVAAECRAELDDKALEDIKDVEDAVAGLENLFGDPKHSRKLPVRERVGFWDARGRHRRDLTEDKRWVDIPAGTYWRGAVPRDREAFDYEKPGHWVKLPAFQIQRWPVTVNEYARFVEADGYENQAWWTSSSWMVRKQRNLTTPDSWLSQLDHPSRPVVCVSWFEAQAYAKWLDTETQPHHPQNSKIRLPTEAEWEAAARGICRQEDERLAQSIYPWGDKWDPHQTNGIHLKLRQTSPVGSFLDAHPRHVWDMSGNIWEWCLDPWSGDYEADLQGKQSDEPLNNPTRFNEAAPVDETSGRVLRGGSFDDVSLSLRVSCRGRYFARYRSEYFGFRVVRIFSPRPLVP